MATLNPTFLQYAQQAAGNLSTFANQNPIQPINIGASTAANVPQWLTPNTQQLQNQYNNIPSEFAGVVAPLQSAYNQSINYNTTLGTQAANSAAQEYATRNAQTGGNASATGVVKAQSLLPVYQQNTAARQQLAGTQAQYGAQAINLQSQIASTLASLNTQYAGTLANYMTQQRAQNIQQATSNQSTELAANNSLLSNAATLSKLGGGSGIQLMSPGATNQLAGTAGYASAMSSIR
jgi:hypothetical protein